MLRLTLAAAAVSLCAGSAFAADTTTTAPAATTMAPATTMAAPAANAMSMSSNGIQMADHATMALKFTTVTPADIMSSKLVGLNVYNNQNDKLGEIEDLAIDNGKTVKGVVISVGGFLGMGESYVLVDPSSLTVSNKDNTWKAFVDTNKDNLKNAPKFTYTKKNS